jgi:hypothetical protein
MYYGSCLREPVWRSGYYFPFYGQEREIFSM